MTTAPKQSQEDGAPPTALGGIRVVDLSRAGPSQAATTLFADFGAEVIAVGQPGFAERRATSGSVSAGHTESVGRNKRSILLDLRNPQGHDVFLRLAATADVVMESFRPGVAARLGVDYESVRQVNQGIIYASLSGFGQSGPYAKVPAHDIQFEAIAGLLPVNAEGVPGVPSRIWADHLATTTAVMGILMALVARERLGIGQYLDLAYLDAAVGAGHGEFDPMLRGAYPCYNVYECADGTYLALGIREPWFWARLCQLVGKEEWSTRQRPEDALHAEMTAFFVACFRRKPRSEWLEALAAVDIEASPVHLGDECATDPQVLARGLIIQPDSPGDGRQVVPALRLSATPWQLKKPVTLEGDSTDEILRELGIDRTETARLRASGAVA